jgi:hypothetical protein
MVLKADLYVTVQKIMIYRELNLGRPVCSHSIYCLSTSLTFQNTLNMFHGVQFSPILSEIKLHRYK